MAEARDIICRLIYSLDRAAIIFCCAHRLQRCFSLSVATPLYRYLPLIRVADILIVEQEYLFVLEGFHFSITMTCYQAVAFVCFACILPLDCCLFI
jgi:hypothetical protein